MPVPGSEATLLHRMLADYTDWLRFLAQADAQSDSLEKRVTQLGQRDWWSWVLTRFLRHSIRKRSRILTLLRPVLEQACAALEQALTDPHVPPAMLTQLTQIHPYTQSHMAEVIQLVTHLENQYRSLR